MAEIYQKLQENFRKHLIFEDTVPHKFRVEKLDREIKKRELTSEENLEINKGIELIYEDDPDYFRRLPLKEP